jgi:RNA polymerase sigma-54 factor
MKAGLFQQQTLKMAMTQELTQAIALLQYSTQELSTFLENKMLENPLLLVDESHIFQPKRNRSKSERTKKKYDAKDWIEQVSKDDSSLEAYLVSQVNLQRLSETEQKGLLLLIRNLDENGYLRVPLEELVTSCITMDILQRSLTILQQLEPYGVGARDLQECLWIQAYGDAGNPLAETLLQDHFLNFANKRWKELSKQLGVSLQDIQSAFDYIQTLNPRPASSFQQEKPAYIVPDVVVKEQDGQFIVGEVDGNLPQLQVDKQYFHQLKQHQDGQVKKFIQEKWQEYQWISRGIQQRKETILRVMRCIIAKQPKCFYHGLEYVKPMTMKEVADELNVHESTVSRAVKGKYVQTPFGTIEMRLFFSTSLSSMDYEQDISGVQAKNLLAAAIKSENKQKPFSDQELVEFLKQEHGIVLARRTVGKYREQLGIPSSSKRKRYDQKTN